MRAVALIQTVSVAAMLWAGLLSLTPKEMAPGDVPPLVALGQEVLPNGLVRTRARFETVPVLISLVVLGVAFAATALLRRHWRKEGLDVPAPDVALSQSRWVLWLGGAALGIYVLRNLTMGFMGAHRGYVPVVGGLWLLSVWYVAAYTILEAQRVGRPLLKEPKVWAGVALAAIPPVIDGLRQISERL
jgi:hypothetical protein